MKKNLLVGAELVKSATNSIARRDRGRNPQDDVIMEHVVCFLPQRVVLWTKVMSE